MRAEPDHDLGHLDRRYRPALMSFFLRRLHNHAEAEDMTQEVFIRLARFGTRVGARMEAADAYIFQTAANLLRDRARAEKTRADYRLGLGAIDQANVELIDPGRVLQGRQTLALLTAGLQELPARTRNIFILYRIQSMTRVEIAASLGITVSAVEKHLARAMAHLTRKLEAGQ